ncbi:MAG: hypothetical protein M1826_007118 [Phylliscum demangeonii]|nr:MAG: hypothetical protein M1826_007118 [Phylliscum demangeonii]
MSSVDGDWVRACHQLLNVRLGPGAAVLPSEIKRIHVEVPWKINNGNRGARHFWRNHLPRLKYHNPTVPITVSRVSHLDAAAEMAVLLVPPEPEPGSTSAPHAPHRDGDGDDDVETYPAASPLPARRIFLDLAPPAAAAANTNAYTIKVFRMQHKQEADIVAQLLLVTGARPVLATKDELWELDELEAKRRASEAESLRERDRHARLQQDRDLLAQAKGQLLAPRRPSAKSSAAAGAAAAADLLLPETEAEAEAEAGLDAEA